VSEPPPTTPSTPPEPPPIPASTPPPRPTTKRGKPKTPRVKRRGIGTYLFAAVMIGLAAFGALQLYDSLTASDSPAVGEHLHAALGVNICGTFTENVPQFETRAGTDTKAGLHSHGDGLIHIHPFVEEEAKDNATVGRYFEYAGNEVDEEHIAFGDELTVTNGDPCPDGRTGEVRWSVNGEEQDGSPGDYKPEDQDVIVIGFLAEGDALGEPPAEVLAALPNPTDVQQDG
jgi:hypothetical protein